MVLKKNMNQEIKSALQLFLSFLDKVVNVDREKEKLRSNIKVVNKGTYIQIDFIFWKSDAICCRTTRMSGLSACLQTDTNAVSMQIFEYQTTNKTLLHEIPTCFLPGGT